MSVETYFPESPNPGTQDERLEAAAQWAWEELQTANRLMTEARSLRGNYEEGTDFHSYYHEQVKACEQEVHSFMDLLIKLTGLSKEAIVEELHNSVGGEEPLEPQGA